MSAQRQTHISTKVFFHPDEVLETHVRGDYAVLDIGENLTVFFMDGRLRSLDHLIGKLETLRAELVGEPVKA